VTNSATALDSDASTLAGLRRRGLHLAWLTIAWNTVEAVVAIAAGASAGSIALVGFGLDSVIEVASSMVIVWQFTGETRHGTDAERERRALRLIALSFFALAAYVTAQAGWDLLSRNEPATSRVGIGLAAVSLVVMPVLALAKRRTGRRMGSPTLVADAAETQLCTYLSAVLLVGLVLDATFGLWWADPVAAVLIAGLAAKEGREAWKGDACC
jgi:divalent metal cation (Fe/Co/Zn/Cd) transporter